MTTYSGDYCARYRDVLPLYALGNVSGEEAAGLREHLESCAVCRREVQELESALNLLPLGLAPIAPAPALKERLLEQLDVSGVEPGAPLLPVAWAQSGAVRVDNRGATRAATSPPGRQPAHERPPLHERGERPLGHERPHRGERSERRRGGRVLRVVEVLLAAAAGVAIYMQHQALQHSRQGQAAAQAALSQKTQEDRALLLQREGEVAAARAELALLAQPEVQVLPLTATEASGRDGGGAPFARILLDRRRKAGLLITAGLPKPPSDRDYQLWLLVKDPGGSGVLPIPAGILQAREGGELGAQVALPGDANLGALAAAAITLEQKGGAQRPTTPPLLTGAI